MKKLLLTILTVGLLAGCGASNKTIIRVGDTWSPTHPIARAMDEVFKPMVEEKTHGEVVVELYHSGTLGNEQTLWDSVRNGSIEMVVVGSVMNSEYTPMLISDWPFLYRNIEHARSVWMGDFASQFASDFHSFFPTAHILGIGPNSARTFTSSKKLTTVADFAGQRFRMPSNPIHIGIASNLGASAQVLPLNELFNALQTGVVDGQDNGMVTVLSEKLNEVQKYLLETNHIIATMFLIANDGFYSKLSPEYQEIIKEASLEASKWAWNTYIASIDTDRANLIASGMIVTPVSEADRQQMINKIEPTLTKLYADNSWAKAMVEQINNVQ